MKELREPPLEGPQRDRHRVSALPKVAKLRPITCVRRFNGGMVGIVRTRQRTESRRHATGDVLRQQTEFPGIDGDDQGGRADRQRQAVRGGAVDAEVDHDGVDVVASSGATVHVMPDKPDIRQTGRQAGSRTPKDRAERERRAGRESRKKGK